MNDQGQFSKRLLLGRYRVVHLLGEGGMGTVYLARTEGAEGFTRPVVIKRMKAEMRTATEGSRLFRREAEILSRLQHPNILNIVDFGEEDGAYLMVLGYVHGYSLMQWMDYRAKLERLLPVDVCLYITRQILAALHYAHNYQDPQGKQTEVIHRDVSPDNVLLNHQGHVHLLDFGVASMQGATDNHSTESGVFRGKLGYAAPETLTGQRATARSDQYSAGILLLELLTFDTPFMADTVAQSVFRMMNEAPPSASNFRSDLPAGLNELVVRAVSKKPNERFQSVKEFARELKRLQTIEDEEVVQLISADVRVDFEALPDLLGIEALKVREEMLARPVLSAPSGLVEREISKSRRLSPEEITTLGAGFAPHRTRNLVIGGATVVLGLVALVLFFWHRNEQQVLVVSGDNRSGASAGDAVGDRGPSSQSATAPTSAAPPASGASAKEYLGAALQQQSGAIETCFAKLLKAGEEPPKVFMHFDVSKAGGKARATVSPAAVASTPLGKCLAQAGGQVLFPKLEADVAFRVPVRAKVSHWNEAGR